MLAMSFLGLNCVSFMPIEPLSFFSSSFCTFLIYFLFVLFIYKFRRLYFSSFNKIHLWISRSALLLLSMRASFLGYVLPYRQISYWRATVIVNLMSVIPFIGPSVCILVWRAYTVNLYTLKRFFTFHFLLPFVILILVFGHILTLHLTGSNSNLSRISRKGFFKLFLIKDLISWIFYFLLLFTLRHLIINLLRDVENFLEANSLVTPLHIKPEWYFLFAYSILRCIPSKTIGVLALLFSVLFPVTIVFSVRKTNNSNLALFIFFFVLLTITRSMPVETPYILIAQIVSVRYFLSYLS